MEYIRAETDATSDEEVVTLRDRCFSTAIVLVRSTVGLYRSP